MTIDYHAYDIGLNVTDVFLQPHSPKWAEVYFLESTRIFNIASAHLPELKLHHIGSTAIKGISAKPIIDILGEVQSVQSMDQYRQIWDTLGYEYKGEYGIPGRRYMTLYNEVKTEAYVHMHVFETDSEIFKTHLMFRDILNDNEDLRLEYEVLKQSLVKNKTPRSEYSPAKAEFITRVLTSLRMPTL